MCLFHESVWSKIMWLILPNNLISGNRLSEGLSDHRVPSALAVLLENDLYAWRVG